MCEWLTTNAKLLTRKRKECMALKVSLSVSVPHEMVDQMDDQKRPDESRSAYVRRLVNEDADDNDEEES